MATVTPLSRKPSQEAVADVLVADRLNVTYRARRGTVTALQDLSLAIPQSSFLSVLGPSGCGKSTLLKLAAGLMRPTSGEIRLNGTPIRGPRRDVGVVFQQPTLLPWRSVLENTLLPIRNLKMDLQAGTESAKELLELVGLSGFSKHYPNELSGGMQQRVAIARALVHAPAVLLMDEPFAALDAMTRETMMDELQRIWMSTSSSVLFITHSIPEAVFLSDRIVVLSDRPGRVVRSLEIELPRPRTIETLADPDFVEICNQLRAMFTKGPKR